MPDGPLPSIYCKAMGKMTLKEVDVRDKRVPHGPCQAFVPELSILEVLIRVDFNVPQDLQRRYIVYSYMQLPAVIICSCSPPSQRFVLVWKRTKTIRASSRILSASMGSSWLLAEGRCFLGQRKLSFEQHTTSSLGCIAASSLQVVRCSMIV